MSVTVEQETGQLFGSLWPRLDEEQYRQSVELFAMRFEANGFDLNWLRGKKCLDAGCGSGRYSVAMALQGAAEVVAYDVSDTGLASAREAAGHYPAAAAKIRFEKGSVLELPFADQSFDFVCCSGVLHHTPSIERGLDQITRVLKPGGKLYLLLYGAGGLRWKLITALRPLAAELGLACIDAAIEAIGLPANNRKHFLDDLYVPIQDFVRWSVLDWWLTARRYRSVERWIGGRFDHEASPEAQIADMEKLERIFAAVPKLKGGDQVAQMALGRIGAGVAKVFIAEAWNMVRSSGASAADIERIIIGEGNHRILATR